MHQDLDVKPETSTDVSRKFWNYFTGILRTDGWIAKDVGLIVLNVEFDNNVKDVQDAIVEAVSVHLDSRREAEGEPDSNPKDVFMINVCYGCGDTFKTMHEDHGLCVTCEGL